MATHGDFGHFFSAQEPDLMSYNRIKIGKMGKVLRQTLGCATIRKYRYNISLKYTEIGSGITFPYGKTFTGFWPFFIKCFLTMT